LIATFDLILVIGCLYCSLKRLCVKYLLVIIFG